MKLLILAAAAFSSSAFAAQPNVKCDVQSLQDAQACMAKVALAYPDYEEPNEGYATDRTGRLVQALRVLGQDERTLLQAFNAAYAGLMIEHGDEHHVYYFAIPQGRDVSPVELYDLNIVDFEYILKKPYTREALNHEIYFLGISEARDSDAYEEVAENLRYLVESEQN
jgi:hypothetical protein